MRYQVVLFDFDGTLADSFPWFVAHMNLVADRFRLRRIAPEEVEPLRDCDAVDLLRRYQVSFWKLPLVAVYMRHLMAKDLKNIALFSGVAGLLGDLKEQGVTLGIVSSNAERNVRRILGDALASRVTYYECGLGMEGKAGRIAGILRKSGIAPADAVFVGDEGRDVEAARKAGVEAIAVGWGYNHACALEKHHPTHLVSTVEELRRVLG